MTTASHQNPPTPRLWPGVGAVALQWIAFFLLPRLVPDAAIYGILGSLALALVFFLWWLFASRLPWGERLAGMALVVGGLVATRPFLHESLATAGMGMLFFIYAMPWLCLAMVLWAVASSRWTGSLRLVNLAAAVLLACGAWTLLRTGGVYGGAGSELAWRWTPSAEDRLLASQDELPPPPATAAVEETEASSETTGGVETESTPTEPEAVADLIEPQTDTDTTSADGGAPDGSPVQENPEDTVTAIAPSHTPEPTSQWPGFRGSHRDGRVVGVRIASDWANTPPTEVWRRPVGPGWSSFAVRGDLVYTQEQRGEEEAVGAYRLDTGEPVWRHRDPVRFWEANAGAGPRGTPTIHQGRVYALGATGILNALDADTGARHWSSDVAADSQTEVPDWGFSSSPLVLDDQVVVAASGQLVAYDLADGSLRWQGPEAGTGYASPQLATFGGAEQILLPDGDGLTSVALDGSTLWRHEWSGYPIVQPAFTTEGDVLLAVSDRSGLRRLAVSRAGDAWNVEERWTSIRLKPYFNDFVVQGDHAYGFDGGILACIDLAEGERQWKGGRYGHGQLILLAEQGLLLVLAEQGDLVLVEASPEGFREVAKVPALEGKTWNHPVLVDDLLLVRNGEEMAAYRMGRAG